MKVELNEVQRKHLESIRWLISKDRKNLCSGRSTVLAFAFIEEAIESGNSVEVFDHWEGRAPYQFEITANNIAVIMKHNYPGYDFKLSLRDRRLRITLKEEVPV